MHLDLQTLWLLVIGTLLLGAAMIAWERTARSERRRELGLLTGAFVTLAMGCAVAVGRAALPGVTGAALANIVIVGGYLMVLDGVAAFDGRGYRRVSAVTLGLLAVGWAVAGARFPNGMWSYVGGVPIAVACAATAWRALRSETMRDLRARHVVAVVSATHALFYTARIALLPALAALHGPDIVMRVATATMYESVLYSVGLSMALLALVREEAHERVLRASRVDYLTGLGNRQWFYEEGIRRFSQDGDAAVAVLVFDLDRFKAVNDAYGHATGDAVLRAFARAVRSATGPHALIGRLGGEEFAVVLSGEDAADARAIGEAVARRFARVPVRTDSGVELAVTVSVGVAERCGDAEDLPGLLAAADRALYVAKALGRNRVELAPPAVRAAA
jgi:diguanylate cyclase (GGDEF)-like protein